MAAKVVELKTERAECIASVVQTLEDALAFAREGGMVAVAVQWVRPDGAINSSRSLCDNIAPVLGAITLGQHRALRTLSGE